MGRQMYPQNDFDDTKVHVMALTGQKKRTERIIICSMGRTHMELGAWELCLAMGPRHGLTIKILVQGPGFKVRKLLTA